MNKEKLKKEFNEKIAKNKIEEVFSLLKSILEHSNPGHHRIAILKEGEWNEIINKERGGREDSDLIRRTKSNIKNVLLELIDDITEEGIRYFNEKNVNSKLKEKQLKDANEINSIIPGSKDFTYKELYITSNLGEENQDKIDKKIDIQNDFLSNDKKTEKLWIIEGKPGQGKSTFIMNIQSENKIKGRPILKINGEDLYWSKFENPTPRDYIKREIEDLTDCTPDQIYTLIIDGWDEIQGDYTPDLGARIVDDLRKASYRVLITSREGFFDHIEYLNKRKLKNRIKKLFLLPHDAENLKKIIERYEDKKGRTPTSKKIFELLNETKYEEIFSNCTGLLILLLINETDLKDIELTENSFIAQIIKERYYIIGRDNLNREFSEKNYERWKKLLSLMAFNIERTGIGGIDLDSLSKSQKEAPIKIGLDDFEQLFSEKAAISAGYLKRKSDKLSFVLSIIREYLCAFYINEVLRNIKKVSSKHFLETFQYLFAQKTYSAQIWNYLKNFIRKYPAKEKSILLKLLKEYLPFVLDNQGLNKYKAKKTQEKGPILRSISTFSAYWRIINLLAETPILIKDVKNIQKLKFCISLIREDHIKDRVCFNNILWNSLPEKQFEGLKYNYTNFSESNFSDKNFRFCIFSKGIFDNVILKNVNFNFCDFSQTSFSNLTFDRCTFSYCNFNSADLEKVTFIESTFKKSNLYECTFKGGEIKDSDFEETELIGANFLNTVTFDNVKFPASDLSSTYFEYPKGLKKDTFLGCKSLKEVKGLPEKIKKEIALDLELGVILDIDKLENYNEKHPELDRVKQSDLQEEEENEKNKQEELDLIEKKEKEQDFIDKEVNQILLLKNIHNIDKYESYIKNEHYQKLFYSLLKDYELYLKQIKEKAEDSDIKFSDYLEKEIIISVQEELEKIISEERETRSSSNKISILDTTISNIPNTNIMNDNIPTDNLKTELRDKISKDKIKEVFAPLKLIFEHSNLEHQKTVILREGDWMNILTRERNGIESRDQINIEKRIIGNVLLQLIEDITPQEALLYNLHYTIFKKILIVCREANRIKAMRELFPEVFYKNTEIVQEENARKTIYEAREAPFDLLIYDDFPISSNSAGASAIFKDILKNKEVNYVLFYGPENLPKKDYKHIYKKVYFSNSPFSIHSRLNEMLLFLKYHSVHH